MYNKKFNKEKIITKKKNKYGEYQLKVMVMIMLMQSTYLHWNLRKAVKYAQKMKPSHCHKFIKKKNRNSINLLLFLLLYFNKFILINFIFGQNEKHKKYNFRPLEPIKEKIKNP